MAIRSKPRKKDGDSVPNLDDERIARFVGGADAAPETPVRRGGEGTPAAGPQDVGADWFPWNAPGLRGDVLNTPFPLRVDGRTKAMLAWLAATGRVRSQNAFLAAIVQEAVADRTVAALADDGLSVDEARAIVMSSSP